VFINNHVTTRYPEARKDAVIAQKRLGGTKVLRPMEDLFRATRMRFRCNVLVRHSSGNQAARSMHLPSKDVPLTAAKCILFHIGGKFNKARVDEFAIRGVGYVARVGGNDCGIVFKSTIVSLRSHSLCLCVKETGKDGDAGILKSASSRTRRAAFLPLAVVWLTASQVAASRIRANGRWAPNAGKGGKRESSSGFPFREGEKTALDFIFEVRK
jgi:hypothetical protein